MPRGIPKERSPLGRPSDYKPEYCDQIIELGKKGYSVNEMAAELDYCTKTLYLWADKFEDFLQAFTRAKIHSRAWYEKENRKNLCNPQYAFKATEFHMKFFHNMREQKVDEILGAMQAETLEEKCDCILDAGLRGDISPQDCEQLMRAACSRSGLKIEDIEKRVQILVEKLGDI